MGWEQTSSINDVYRQIVREGFILTQGYLNLGFEDNPFGEGVIYPSFQLLQVHKRHPIEIGFGGRVSIRPVGDTRFPAEIWRDKNPKVYDTVSFILLPYEREDLQYLGSPWKKLATLDGFMTSEGGRNRVSLLYFGGKGLEIDGQHTITVSTIIPPQIPEHFNHWLWNAGKLQRYDRLVGHWKDIGRFDFKSLGIANDVGRKLEERFNTKILVQNR